MSSILESIKKEQLQARKDKDKIKTKSLTTIIGEIAIVKRTKKLMTLQYQTWLKRQSKIYESFLTYYF